MFAYNGCWLVWEEKHAGISVGGNVRGIEVCVIRLLLQVMKSEYVIDTEDFNIQIDVSNCAYHVHLGIPNSTLRHCFLVISINEASYSPVYVPGRFLRAKQIKDYLEQLHASERREVQDQREGEKWMNVQTLNAQNLLVEVQNCLIVLLLLL
ncbi:8981_t:CDS:2 [Paraglomus occultum]|uniref:8981_t:CDS:1 n=1 Tax=Paraglomus occultum TaxID=144539 RepID=A0A9N9B3Y2_9GLOM|nr:8981_t:CDS:2 [Paraglomus occultum]